MSVEKHTPPVLEASKRASLLQAYHEFIKNNPKIVKSRYLEEPDFYIDHDALAVVVVGNDK